jgi:hypothetical protein
VARGIRKGARSLGGLPYQILAVSITYLCIAANYAPDIYLKLRPRGMPSIELIVGTVLYSLGVPFFGGAKNILGIIIIGFGLYQAWRMTGKAKLPLSGPYRVGGGPHASVNRGFEVLPARSTPTVDPMAGPGGNP